MDHARVAVFEDQESIRQILSLSLSARGHTVALEACDMDAARNLIETLEEDSFDVAVVDGNLGEGTVSGDDGAEIARLLRQKGG